LMKCEDLVVVVRGGVEPPTFRFSEALSWVQDHLHHEVHQPRHLHQRWSGTCHAIVAVCRGVSYSAVPSVLFAC
jgi:hypothetical protein